MGGVMADRTCQECSESYRAADGHECQDILSRSARMLRRLEWVRLDMDDGCPACGACKEPERPSRTRPGHGQHESDCELAALLRDLP